MLESSVYRLQFHCVFVVYVCSDVYALVVLLRLTAASHCNIFLCLCKPFKFSTCAVLNMPVHVSIKKFWDSNNMSLCFKVFMLYIECSVWFGYGQRAKPRKTTRCKLTDIVAWRESRTYTLSYKCGVNGPRAICWFELTDCWMQCLHTSKHFISSFMYAGLWSSIKFTNFHWVFIIAILLFADHGFSLLNRSNPM